MNKLRWSFLLNLFFCLAYSLPISATEENIPPIMEKGAVNFKDSTEKSPSIHLIYEFDPSHYLMGLVNLQNGMVTHTECDVPMEGAAAHSSQCDPISALLAILKVNLGCAAGAITPFRSATF